MINLSPYKTILLLKLGLGAAVPSGAWWGLSPSTALEQHRCDPSASLGSLSLPPNCWFVALLHTAELSWGWQGINCKNSWILPCMEGPLACQGEGLSRNRGEEMQGEWRAAPTAPWPWASMGNMDLHPKPGHCYPPALLFPFPQLPEAQTISQPSSKSTGRDGHAPGRHRRRLRV